MQLSRELPVAWKETTDEFFASSEGKKLEAFLEQRKQEIGADNIYPPDPLRFLRLIHPKDIKVVILGQDPYHGEGQANGLAFSVNPGIKIPPSLRNIYKEMVRTFGGQLPKNGDLTYLAEQGVLLLNASLTVEKASPASHSKIGWEVFTDRLLEQVAKRNEPTVYMLWGNFARTKKAIIEKFVDVENSLILESNHPSPLSATKPPIPFIGNSHFVKANEWLESKGLKAINWLPEQKENNIQQEFLFE